MLLLLLLRDSFSNTNWLSNKTNKTKEKAGKSKIRFPYNLSIFRSHCAKFLGGRAPEGWRPAKGSRLLINTSFSLFVEHLFFFFKKWGHLLTLRLRSTRKRSEEARADAALPSLGFTSAVHLPGPSLVPQSTSLLCSAERGGAAKAAEDDQPKRSCGNPL